MSTAWFDVIRKFRQCGKNWSNLNDQEKEVWRAAYREQFGKEYKPRTLAERWAREDLTPAIIHREKRDL